MCSVDPLKKSFHIFCMEELMKKIVIPPQVNQSDVEQAEIFINKTTRTEKLVIPWLYTTRINKRRDKHYNIAKNFSKIYPDIEFYVLSSGKMISAESIFQRETGITR